MTLITRTQPLVDAPFKPNVVNMRKVAVQIKVLHSAQLGPKYLWQPPKDLQGGISYRAHTALKQYCTEGIHLDLVKIILPVFPSVFLTSQLSFHLQPRMLWFSWPLTYSHPLRFEESNVGGRKGDVCEWWSECVPWMLQGWLQVLADSVKDYGNSTVNSLAFPERTILVPSLTLMYFIV